MTKFNPNDFTGRAEYDVRDVEGNIVVNAGKRLTKKKAQSLMEEGLEWIEYPVDVLMERHLATPVIDQESGEVLYDVVTALDETKLKKMIEQGINTITVITSYSIHYTKLYEYLARSFF